MELDPTYVLTATAKNPKKRSLDRDPSSEDESEPAQKRIKLMAPKPDFNVQTVSSEEHNELKKIVLADPSSLTITTRDTNCFADLTLSDLSTLGDAGTSTVLVLQACSAVPSSSTCAPVAIKIMGITPVSQDDQDDGIVADAMAEATILQWLNTNFLDTKLTPHIVPLKFIRKCSLSSVREWIEQTLPGDDKRVSKFDPELDDANECIIMITERLEGALKAYITERDDDIERFSEADLQAVIFQTLYTLAQIQHEDPSFRHNDLHLGNVLIFKTRFTEPAIYKAESMTFKFPVGTIRSALWDFGYSGTKMILNGLIHDQTYLQEDYGIINDDSELTDVVIKNVYDAHYFLNAIWNITDGGELLTENEKKFFDFALPEVVRGIDNTYLGNSRLTYKVQMSSEMKNVLKTPLEMLRNSYFDKFRVLDK